MIVPDAHLAYLDPDALDHLIGRLRMTRGPAFARAGITDMLRMAGVIPRGENNDAVTLAGLMALGKYPQEFFPQLNVTFVSYPRVDGRMMADGTRFLDNVSIDGPIPLMVTGLVNTVTQNMTKRSVMVGIWREDRWEYPRKAIRELIVNALMHRDYHPLAHGTQVRVEMYPDRLEFTNPGGLYGSVSPSELFQGGVSSSRNVVLARLLEDIEMVGMPRTVCENRGSGLKMVVDELADAGLKPPLLRSSIGSFTIELRNNLFEQQSRPAATSGQQTQILPESAHRILESLAHGPQTTRELVGETGLSRSGVSTRLRDLEGRGLVTPLGDRHSPSVRWGVVSGR